MFVQRWTKVYIFFSPSYFSYVVIHETKIISVSAISEVEMVKIISVLNLKKSDSRN
jgi:hypothetical protein